ncbi:MAG TPA: glycosyltransferase family 4 protein [Burkholderiales bacterium]|jgi:glycosyltransferase involved in cell wall biosynthesis
MHICFVAPHAWPVFSADSRIAQVGGAEVQQSVLARLLAARGHRVSMICLDYGQPDRSVIDGVTVHKAFAPEAGAPVLRFVHPRLTSMWRAMREVDADIYYCRSASMWVGLLAEFCRRYGRRSIYAAASDADFVPRLGGQIRYARDRWLYRRGLARVDRIVAQNELQRATCRATYGRDAVVIPSCYQPLRSPGAAIASRDCVLWVATVRAGKRPELFLELAARLPHRRFVMVGGPERGDQALFERTRQAAARLGNVEFTGFLPLAEVEKRLDNARVLVNTSEYEGMPNTFLQAWAHGVPTLATVDAGTPVHRRFRDVDAGAGEIEALFRDPVRWQRASGVCREHFERNHSGAETLARYGQLFEGLAA